MADSQAQDNYNQSIGLRGGPLVGVSYKRFIDVPTVIEGIAGFNFTNGRLVNLTGLYQRHLRVTYDLNVFAGAGLSLGFRKDYFRLGGDAIVGIEYTIPRFPVNLSIDYKPVYDVIRNEFYWNEFGLSIRYHY